MMDREFRMPATWYDPPDNDDAPMDVDGNSVPCQAMVPDVHAEMGLHPCCARSVLETVWGAFYCEDHVDTDEDDVYDEDEEEADADSER